MRQGPAWPTPDPFPSHHSHPPAHTRLSWDQEMPSQPCPNSIPVQRWVQTPCRGATRLPTPPSHGQGTGSKGRLCPALPRQCPSQAGGHCIIAWFGGSLAVRILLGKIEFLDAKKEQTHPSVVIKTTVRLPPLLLLALGKALPWEYQVGRLVVFQIQEQESGKEFLHSTRPAKGLLSSICSLQGIRGLSPSGGGGRTEYKALWGKCIYTTVPIKPPLPIFQLFSNPSSWFFPNPLQNSKSCAFIHFSSYPLYSFPQNFLQLLGVTQEPYLIKT